MTATAKLRWGILGTAKINERLLPAFRKSATADLRAIASRSPDKARQAAREAGIPVGHGSYEALLADPEIDAVYIPLPNNLHGEWTRRAADKGKHVLCEKPLTPTAAEARELVDYCRAKGVRLMDGFMWPHHPRTAALRKFLDEGGIGTVQRAVGTLTFKLEPLSPENIRLKPELGGGSLLDVGCYPVFGIRWAFGAEPVRAWATARTMNGVDVEMCGTLWFADGRTASFDCGFTLPQRGWLEVVGTQGVVRVPQMWLPPPEATFEVYGTDGELRETRRLPEADQIVCMLDDFAAAVREKREAVPSPDEAVKTLRVLDALAKSAREGRAVEV